MTGVKDGPFGAQLGDDQILEVELVIGQLLPELIQDAVIHLTERLSNVDPFGHLGRCQRTALQLNQLLFEGEFRYLVVSAAGQHQRDDGQGERGQPSA